jgi:CelD/BcsL family acetyltransferase involved in cellulose biosynthesis
MVTTAAVTRLEGGALPGDLAADWNRLAGETPCRRWEWLEPWWRHFRGRGDELFVLVVRGERGELLGIAPFYVSKSIAHGRVVRFLGSGDVCSDYLTILTTSEAQTLVLDEIADYFTGEAFDAWDLIELVGVEESDSAIAGLVERLRQREHVVHQQSGESCWRLELPDTWESYVKTLSKTRRERIRQIVRRSFDTGQAVSRQVTSRHELPRFFDLLVELHQKRRRSLGERGCFADSVFTGYHRDVMERFFELERLRLQYTLLDERPIAVEYDLIGDNTIYFYQSGIETDLLDKRPGWIGTIGSVRSAIEQGYRAFDFMRGDEAYKSSWGAKPRPMIETRVVAHGAAAHLRHTAWLAQQQMRRWAKSYWGRKRGDANGESKHHS